MDYQFAKKLYEFGDHEEAVSALAFMPSGDEIICASEDQIKIWNLHSRQAVFSFKVDGTVRGIIVEPDGKRFLCGIEEGGVRVWHREEREASYVYGPREADIIDLAISPDGRLFAAITPSEIMVYNIRSLRRERHQTLRSEGLASIAWTQEGDCYLTGTLEGYLSLWELETARLMWEKYEDGSPIHSVCFHPTGYLLSHRWTRGIARYTANGGEVSIFRGHEGEISSATFDHFGTHIITASYGPEGDDTIRFFSFADQRPLGCLECEEMTTMAFGPKGKFLVAGTEEGTIAVFG